MGNLGIWESPFRVGGDSCMGIRGNIMGIALQQYGDISWGYHALRFRNLHWLVKNGGPNWRIMIPNVLDSTMMYNVQPQIINNQKGLGFEIFKFLSFHDYPSVMALEWDEKTLATKVQHNNISLH